MTEPVSSVSSVKLGLDVAWPAFWTGVPIKFVVALLMLAMGVHPWELPALAFLLLLSIPVDIWALALSAKTVFLDRLRVTPPAGIGLTLWWQAALFSALFLPVAYFVESQTIAGAKAVAGQIMELEVLKSLPVAEKISIELVLWSSVATVVLLALALGWLFVFGRLVRHRVRASSPADAPYQALVRQWDLMRIPADQPLLLTVVTGTGVLLVLLLWAFMPVMTPQPHELYQKQPVKTAPPFRPTEALQKTEKLISQAEGALQSLEAKAQEESREKGKGKDKKKGKDKGTGKEAAKP
ncbi:MAG: hypothetical protein HY581_03580 [Nitrospirae bacterium]|nr:hypothetical protein [Nitrospirota bacterium]